MNTNMTNTPDSIFDRFESLLLERHRQNHQNFLINSQIIEDSTAEMLGKRIRALRQRLQLTQIELASLAEIPTEIVMALETGLILTSEIQSVWLESLANVFHLEINELRIIVDEGETSQPWLPPKSSLSAPASKRNNNNFVNWSSEQFALLKFRSRAIFSALVFAVSMLWAMLSPTYLFTAMGPSAPSPEQLRLVERVIPPDHQIPDKYIRAEADETKEFPFSLSNNLVACAPTQKDHYQLASSPSLVSFIKGMYVITFKP